MDEFSLLKSHLHLVSPLIMAAAQDRPNIRLCFFEAKNIIVRFGHGRREHQWTVLASVFWFV